MLCVILVNTPVQRTGNSSRRQIDSKYSAGYSTVRDTHCSQKQGCWMDFLYQKIYFLQWLNVCKTTPTRVSCVPVNINLPFLQPCFLLGVLYCTCIDEGPFRRGPLSTSGRKCRRNIHTKATSRSKPTFCVIQPRAHGILNCEPLGRMSAFRVLC